MYVRPFIYSKSTNAKIANTANVSTKMKQNNDRVHSSDCDHRHKEHGKVVVLPEKENETTVFVCGFCSLFFLRTFF